MKCCANCFNDEYLSEKISTPNSPTGTCSYCKSESTSLIDPIDLMDEFDFLLSIYGETASNDGKPIIDCLIDDWELFTGRDKLASTQLLGIIIGDPRLGSKFFTPVKMTETSPKEKWDHFCDELISIHRFFPEAIPDLDYLPLLFRSLKEHVEGLIFRARIQKGPTKFKKSEMGMPPAQSAKGGRANPVGIPYFYAASNIETAIAETRPHPGNNVSICKFKIIDSIEILNLINPRKEISPFKVAFDRGEDDYLLRLRYDVEFLCHLGNELSKPIIPDDAELKYLPTQYLCELIKKSNFDGVKFKSSVGDGVNYTLFGQQKVKPVSVLSHYVSDLKYSTVKNRN